MPHSYFRKGGTSKLRRTLSTRSSQNAVRAKFGKPLFYEDG
jgi:hypothetical protein